MGERGGGLGGGLGGQLGGESASASLFSSSGGCCCCCCMPSPFAPLSGLCMPYSSLLLACALEVCDECLCDLAKASGGGGGGAVRVRCTYGVRMIAPPAQARSRMAKRMRFRKMEPLAAGAPLPPPLPDAWLPLACHGHQEEEEQEEMGWQHHQDVLSVSP